MLPYTPADFDAIFAAGGMAELIGDERSSSLPRISQNSTFLYERLHAIAAQRTTAEWLAFCETKRIPVGRVPKLEELVAELPVETHPVVGDYRLIPPPVQFGDSPAGIHLHTRLHGQDTIAMLREAGLSEEAIKAMIERGAALDNRLTE
jgi:crotonobetainyl-CoA:carnitine CoA-transferase CaiB-like acyl-CoA transferase